MATSGNLASTAPRLGGHRQWVATQSRHGCGPTDLHRPRCQRGGRVLHPVDHGHRRSAGSRSAARCSAARCAGRRRRQTRNAVGSSCSPSTAAPASWNWPRCEPTTSTRTSSPGPAHRRHRRTARPRPPLASHPPAEEPQAAGRRPVGGRRGQRSQPHHRRSEVAGLILRIAVPAAARHHEPGRQAVPPGHRRRPGLRLERHLDLPLDPARLRHLQPRPDHPRRLRPGTACGAGIARPRRPSHHPTHLRTETAPRRRTAAGAHLPTCWSAVTGCVLFEWRRLRVRQARTFIPGIRVAQLSRCTLRSSG